MITLKLPGSAGHDITTIQIQKNLIIVGANGSGKTRLGSAIEGNNNPTKRLSAQRYLQVNDQVQQQDFETASNSLRNSYKHQSPITPQNDYQQVMTSLFAQEAKRNSDYVFASLASEEKISVPQSVKDKTLATWNSIFSYRALKLEQYKALAEGSEGYFSISEMSDGEKVGLYLISQTQLADANCILIIDEPELHLHKSLMVRLWNELELSRPDCTFVYITHDLDFAVSKPSSRLLWIRKYEHRVWHWEEISPNDVIPENLYLEVLGSRKPILFVEGDKGSLDIQIYQSYYDGFTVIPRGSCEQVIQSVKGLSANQQLHDKKVFGLIDKDFRLEAQLASLAQENIFSIPLNEIENIFLVPEILELVCNYMGKSEKTMEVVSKIREIYDSIRGQISFLASKFRIQNRFNQTFGEVRSQADYENFKHSLILNLDGEIISFTVPTKEENLVEILKVYPYKGLVKIIQPILELTKEGYRNLVLNLLISEKRGRLIEILKQYLPIIPTGSA